MNYKIQVSENAIAEHQVAPWSCLRGIMNSTAVASFHFGFTTTGGKNRLGN